jgi:hypothetical protein
MLESHTQNDALFSYMKRLLNKGIFFIYNLQDK